MRIYTVEDSGKHYMSYERAVESLTSRGWELVNHVDRTSEGAENHNAKAMFRRRLDPATRDTLFPSADPVQHTYIAYLDTQD